MSNFIDKNEQLICNEFIDNGFIVKEASNITSLNILQEFLVEQSSKILFKNHDSSNKAWLNNIHKIIEVDQLNDFRLHLIQ